MVDRVAAVVGPHPPIHAPLPPHRYVFVSLYAGAYVGQLGIAFLLFREVSGVGCGGTVWIAA